MSFVRQALICLAAAGLLACASHATAQTPKPTVVVGTEATFPPFESLDENKNFVGYDVDLVNAIGEKIGAKVVWKDMPFDSLIGALQSGQISMIASGFSITEERKGQVEYSDAYMNAGIAMAVRKGDTSIKSKDDLKGKVAAVQLGATGAKAAEQLQKDGVLKNVKQFPTVPLALMELTKGGADVVISDRPTTEACLAQMNAKVVLLPSAQDLQADNYGFAFRKGNTELARKVNEAMKQLKAEGFFDKLAQKHLAAKPQEEKK
jgi:ABC-type amino acid transport substrate-binding protein